MFGVSQNRSIHYDAAYRRKLIIYSEENGNRATQNRGPS